MTHDELRELIARACCIEEGRDPDSLDAAFICDRDNNPLPAWEWYATTADAILAALSTAGLAIVPVEATDHMLSKGCELECTDDQCLKTGICRREVRSMNRMGEHWSAMLAASPFTKETGR